MKRGAAHAKGLYTYPGGSGTQFSNGSSEIFNIGLRTLKVYATPNYASDYPFETWSSSPTNLTQLAQTTEFVTEFAKAWDTIVITTFTFANGTTNWWRVDVNNVKLQAEYAEYFNYVVYLLTTYSGTNKTFILQNWEGDWAFMDAFTVDTYVDRKMIDQYCAYLSIRQKAVRDAKRSTPHSGVSVLNAIELNRVLDAKKYPHRRRILTDIAPRLQPDIVSFSAYEATTDAIFGNGGWGVDQADWESKCTTYLTNAIRLIKHAFPGVPLYIGEFGFPENEATNEHPTHDVAAMIQKVNDIAISEGLTHLLYWQVFDNEPHATYTYRGYWLQKPNGTLSIAGTKFAALGP